MQATTVQHVFVAILRVHLDPTGGLQNPSLWAERSTENEMSLDDKEGDYKTEQDLHRIEEEDLSFRLIQFSAKSVKN